MPANKVKYNLKNVHYAVWNSGTSSYGTPVAIPGAVNLSLSAENEEYVFYADGIAYFAYNNNNGYSGDLEVALIPQSFKEDVLGEAVDNNAVIVETSAVQTTYFALGFEIDGDQQSTLFWFYNGTATRPEIAGQTKEESIEVNTETLNVRFRAGSDGYVKAATTPSTADADRTAWFTAVYTPDF